MDELTIEKGINDLGDCFRGLWRSRTVQEERLSPLSWTVTFIYNGDVVETSAYSNPEGALREAILILMNQGLMNLNKR